VSVEASSIVCSDSVREDLRRVFVNPPAKNERLPLEFLAARIVEDDHPDRMPIQPEVFIILFYGTPDVAQSVGRYNKKEIFS
jgi:hypothetical protein